MLPGADIAAVAPLAVGLTAAVHRVAVLHPAAGLLVAVSPATGLTAAAGPVAGRLTSVLLPPLYAVSAHCPLLALSALTAVSASSSAPALSADSALSAPFAHSALAAVCLCTLGHFLLLTYPSLCAMYRVWRGDPSP